ncbi:MAG: helix-turn-helix domain-containing protein, partial [Vibrio sp.]
AAMQSFQWPGNVRQLENICRWLTVMASSSEILIDDLPDEIVFGKAKPANVTPNANDLAPSVQLNQTTAHQSWQDAFKAWADDALQSHHMQALQEVQVEFEQILIETALKHTHGHKQDAAKLLGWGRNTITRKLKEIER